MGKIAVMVTGWIVFLAVFSLWVSIRISPEIHKSIQQKDESDLITLNEDGSAIFQGDLVYEDAATGETWTPTQEELDQERQNRTKELSILGEFEDLDHRFLFLGGNPDPWLEIDGITDYGRPTDEIRITINVPELIAAYEERKGEQDDDKGGA